jgi:hypothetical protein
MRAVVPGEALATPLHARPGVGQLSIGPPRLRIPGKLIALVRMSRDLRLVDVLSARDSNGQAASLTAHGADYVPKS